MTVGADDSVVLWVLHRFGQPRLELHRRPRESVIDLVTRLLEERMVQGERGRLHLGPWLVRLAKVARPGETPAQTAERVLTAHLDRLDAAAAGEVDGEVGGESVEAERTSEPDDADVSLRISPRMLERVLLDALGGRFSPRPGQPGSHYVFRWSCGETPEVFFSMREKEVR